MSLVSEALKKAEREAAAREGRAKGLPPSMEAPLQPYRAPRGGQGRRNLTLVLAVVGGAAAVALTLFLARPRQDEEDSNKGATPPANVLQAAPAPTGPNLGAPSAAPPSASEVLKPQPATPPLPKTTSPPPSPTPSASEPRTPPPPPAPAGKPPAGIANLGSRDYLRQVDLPGGGKLELGGIVYSEAAPFAYLNGRLVGVGEFVEGFRIDRIERQRVILTGDSGEITLRLKGP